MIQATEKKRGTDFRAEFEARNAKRSEPDWLQTARRQALERFEQQGLPTTHDERWKYTNVSPLGSRTFAPATDPVDVDKARIEAIETKAETSARLVFVDGCFRRQLSTPVSGALEAENLLSGGADPLRELLGSALHEDDHAFVALNTALFDCGGLVRVAPGQVIERPIELLFVSTDHGPERSFHPRVLIELGANSRATILETWVGFDRAANLTNAVTEVVLGEGAVLEHYKVVEESAAGTHLGAARSRLARDASLVSHVYALGGGLVRSELDVRLDGEGSSCDLNGLYLTHGSEHVDTQIFVDHAVPHATSNQRFHGVLDGRSRGVFNGRVLVRPDAQQTAAHQTNRNLILSEAAIADTKPQLEIHADDVRCTHGATIGQLDETAVFYLRSRGIGEVDARNLLTRAFAQVITQRITLAPLAERIDWSLSRHFLEHAATRP